MTHRIRSLAGGMLALAASLPLAGCGRVGAEDPARAQDVLRAALDAWKDGRTPDETRQNTGIVVNEPLWSEGHKLTRHEIQEGSEAAGFDLRCQAELWTEAPDGRASREKVFYTVSTHPARTVVREGFDRPLEPIRPKTRTRGR